MSKKDDYFVTMDSQVKTWDAAVDKLNAESAKMSAESREIYDEQIKLVRDTRDAAFKNMEEMRAASESTWQQMQAGVDAAWNSMKDALDKASTKILKKPLSAAGGPGSFTHRVVRVAGSRRFSGSCPSMALRQIKLLAESRPYVRFRTESGGDRVVYGKNTDR